MPKAIDLTGRKIYRWTVIEKRPSPSFADSYICKCDCGTVAQVRGNNLKKGATRGCKNCKLQPKRKHIDYGEYVGLIHGNRLIVGIDPNCKRNLLCYCACGSYDSVQGNLIVRGISKRCRKCQSANLVIKSNDLYLNKQFGKWLVIQRDPNGEAQRCKYICRCVCGTELSIAAYDLMSRRTRQCKNCWTNDLKSPSLD